MKDLCFGFLPTGGVEENGDHSEAGQGREGDGCIGACSGHQTGEEAATDAGDAEGRGDVGAGGDHRRRGIRRDTDLGCVITFGK